MANFCRSPVAEFFLKKKFSTLNIFSAGIEPLYLGGMDKRSLHYISEFDSKIGIHNPKKINIKMVRETDIFLAMDPIILSILNQHYSRYQEKFKLFSKGSNFIVHDPYKFDDEKYRQCMDLIKNLSENFILE